MSWSGPRCGAQRQHRHAPHVHPFGSGQLRVRPLRRLVVCLADVGGGRSPHRRSTPAPRERAPPLVSPAMSTGPFPEGFFDRADAGSDARFYSVPRFVTHIDDAAIAAVGELYEALGIRGDVLDLMGSWVSHFRVAPARLTVLGMNEAELAANPAATATIVHDLNADPVLPFDAGVFDAVVCCVSVDYLLRPVEVFRDVRRVLRPGDRSCARSRTACSRPKRSGAGWPPQTRVGPESSLRTSGRREAGTSRWSSGARREAIGATHSSPSGPIARADPSHGHEFRWPTSRRLQHRERRQWMDLVHASACRGPWSRSRPRSAAGCREPTLRALGLDGGADAAEG